MFWILKVQDSCSELGEGQGKPEEREMIAQGYLHLFPILGLVSNDSSTAMCNIDISALSAV